MKKDETQLKTVVKVTRRSNKSVEGKGNHVYLLLECGHEIYKFHPAVIPTRTHCPYCEEGKND